MMAVIFALLDILEETFRMRFFGDRGNCSTALLAARAAEFQIHCIKIKLGISPFKCEKNELCFPIITLAPSLATPMRLDKGIFLDAKNSLNSLYSLIALQSVVSTHNNSNNLV